MSIHSNYESMIKESLHEMMIVAKKCFENKENGGIYGYPLALILVCIAECISGWSGYGEYSYEALNDKDLYNLNLESKILERIKKDARNPLAHNAVLHPGIVLSVENPKDEVFYISGDNSLVINLQAFYERTLVAISGFEKSKLSSISSTKIHSNLLKKPNSNYNIDLVSNELSKGLNESRVELSGQVLSIEEIKTSMNKSQGNN